MKIKKFGQLNEGKNINPINYSKLLEYAKAISVLCNGEYGIVYYNEKQNHVFVCLGDSNPFHEDLQEYMKDAISKDYNSSKDITITIENECGPNSNEEGWVKIKV